MRARTHSRVIGNYLTISSIGLPRPPVSSFIKERERARACVCVCVYIYIYIYTHTHTYVIQKYRTIGSFRPPTSFIRGSTVMAIYIYMHIHTRASLGST